MPDVYRLYLESLICYYNILCCNMLWLGVPEENPGTLWIFCVGSLGGPEIILDSLPFSGKFLHHCDCLQFGVFLLISEVYCCLYSLPPFHFCFCYFPPYIQVQFKADLHVFTDNSSVTLLFGKTVSHSWCLSVLSFLVYSFQLHCKAPLK